MRLHPDKKNRPIDFSLTTDDIELAQPSKRGLDWPRHTNPLNPNYELPSFQAKPITPPKFVRDGFPVHDIEGASVRTLIDTSKPARDAHLTVRDIDGTWPDYQRMRGGYGFKYTTGNEKPAYNLETADINAPYTRVPSIRNTNPLEPEYLHRTTKIVNVTSPPVSGGFETCVTVDKISLIEGSKPRMRARELKNTVCNINRSDDIELAHPQRFVGGIPFNSHLSTFKRHPFSPSDPHQVNDIQGAQAMTLAKGIEKTTTRHLNPLVPQYSWDTAPIYRAPPVPAAAPPSYLPDYDIITGVRFLRPKPGASTTAIVGHSNIHTASRNPMATTLPAGSVFFPNLYVSEEFANATNPPMRSEPTSKNPNLEGVVITRESPALYCAPGTVPPEFAPSVANYSRSPPHDHPALHTKNKVFDMARETSSKGDSAVASSVSPSGASTPQRAARLMQRNPNPGGVSAHLLQAAGRQSAGIGATKVGSRRGSNEESNNQGKGITNNNISKATAMLLRSALQPDAQSLKCV
eukprot:GDKK01065439.1.p1 GENE.GDKK01065439.1~~GDKK01065439.1.p1  ORF type:complete len:521 (-),score=85.09 GDKK01065439.1:174-1736(-)